MESPPRGGLGARGNTGKKGARSTVVVYKYVQDKVQRAVIRALRAFERFEPTNVLITVVRNVGAHGVGDMAASLAYYGILAIFPLGLVLIALLSLVLDQETVENELSTVLSQHLPQAEWLVGDNIDAVFRLRGTIGLLSLLMLMWSGSAVFGALTRFLDRAWGVTKSDAFHLVRARSLVMVLVVASLLVVSLVSSGLLHAASGLAQVEQLGVWGEFLASGARFALGLGSLVGSIVAVMVIYRFLPSERIAWRYVAPSAVFVGVLLEAGKNLFLFYLTQFASYVQVYGSLASVIVLLFWIFLSSFIVILGAEIGGAYRHRARGR